MKLRDKLFIVIAIAVVGTILTYRHWSVLRYEVRLANVKLFQNGEIAGGTTVQLTATYHRQEHSLSCEIAALKMALSVFNINPSESELISKLNFDPTPHSKGVWGNPFTGFVGNIDGKDMVDGYGVYAQPIADVGNQYAKATIIQANPMELAKQLDQGNPIIVWGYVGSGRHIKWTTPGGSTIDAINGEHARTIIGYWGSPAAPTGFIIYDPIYGILKWKTADLVRNMQPFANMAVVISKS